MSFGFLWILGMLGWRHSSEMEPLHRWRLLLLPILVAPFVVVANVQRAWTYAFPILIPIALLGLRGVLPPTIAPQAATSDRGSPDST